MSFNDLPDNCLWKIFENVHGVKDLVQLSKVCSRWSDLITLKFNRVKYLRLMTISDAVDYIDANSLWLNHATNWNDYNLIKLFPNLKIIEVSSYSGVIIGSDILARILNDNPNIKGLIGLSNSIGKSFDLKNIEMCAAEFSFDFKKVFRHDQLKQVRCFYFFTYDLPAFIEYFPNLIRLNLELDEADEVFYNGPNLSSLKILELDTTDLVEQFTGFHFMDFCPSLESAFIHCWAYALYVDESIKNYNLRDLVIVNTGFFSWSILRRLLSKFPNLHHLAIRHIDKLDDNNLEELIKLLPNLKILDLRGCKKMINKSADFPVKYCVKKNRSFEIYYDCKNEPTEWPKLVDTCEPICYGFDFMKHCFYKSLNCLPVLIDE
ncbi:uncharacterized protein LOC128388980 [Panonychus citri]|uniref:uncharacterized protein LOC128388980 n=1 Tax=Panonychus citri TaxID=50023 RepID=UPI00230782B0|nr:uncharacterized protein LOC128388980 [Panonychus citri]